MTLSEAIEEVKENKAGLFYESRSIKGVYYLPNYTAIATILNAVVKGELVTKPEPRKAILNRYAMRNGITKEQRPDESREHYNLRVYGLREEDIE